MLRQQAWRQGMGKMAAVVVLMDGVSGLETMQQVNCAGAISIVDFDHALEHAGLYAPHTRSDEVGGPSACQTVGSKDRSPMSGEKALVKRVKRR